MQHLRVKNWEKYQHYKDRNPPWIKLHRTLLDDYEFSMLPDGAKLDLILIWLLAGSFSGRVPAEPKFLQRKLGLSKPPNLKALVDQGFLIPEQDASNVLADSLQGAPPTRDARARSASASASERNGKATTFVSAREAGPTDEHRALAAGLGLDCDAEWAAFWDRVAAKEKAWFVNAEPAFRNWLRQERKFAAERKAGRKTKEDSLAETREAMFGNVLRELKRARPDDSIDGESTRVA